MDSENEISPFGLPAASVHPHRAVLGDDINIYDETIDKLVGLAVDSDSNFLSPGELDVTLYEIALDVDLATPTTFYSRYPTVSRLLSDILPGWTCRMLQSPGKSIPVFIPAAWPDIVVEYPNWFCDWLFDPDCFAGIRNSRVDFGTDLDIAEYGCPAGPVDYAVDSLAAVDLDSSVESMTPFVIRFCAGLLAFGIREFRLLYARPLAETHDDADLDDLRFKILSVAVDDMGIMGLTLTEHREGRGFDKWQYGDDIVDQHLDFVDNWMLPLYPGVLFSRTDANSFVEFFAMRLRREFRRPLFIKQYLEGYDPGKPGEDE